MGGWVNSQQSVAELWVKVNKLSCHTRKEKEKRVSWDSFKFSKHWTVILKFLQTLWNQNCLKPKPFQQLEDDLSQNCLK